MAIISLSGKKQSGKSTVGKIINIILNSPQLNNEGVLNFLKKDNISSKDWHIKMFAEKLKQIACILLGCTMEQLEDEKFKNSYLDESWDKWSITSQFDTTYYLTKQEALESHGGYYEPVLVRMTPRLLLQLLGTECGREIIHPQIWVNSLFADYKLVTKRGEGIPLGPTTYTVPALSTYPREHWNKTISCKYFEWEEYPNWIITDMRFPNELEAIKVRGGITIRVNRNIINTELIDGSFIQGKIIRVDEHASETALDKTEFDYTINNDGTLEDLINKVREILTKEKLLNND